MLSLLCSGEALEFPELCSTCVGHSPEITRTFNALSFSQSLPLKRTDVGLYLWPIPRKEIKYLDDNQAHSSCFPYAGTRRKGHSWQGLEQQDTKSLSHSSCVLLTDTRTLHYHRYHYVTSSEEKHQPLPTKYYLFLYMDIIHRILKVCLMFNYI
jgi:hypothetical protein